MNALDIAPALESPITSPPTFAQERPQDGPAVDALVDRAFGPGRYAKTAERLREGNRLRHDLSICAWRGEALVGAVRQWPIHIGETSAVFLGPIAVDEAERSHGLGGALVERAVAAAMAADERLILLIGSLNFFSRCGFSPAPSRLIMPGPVDPGRLLWRALKDGGLDDLVGAVTCG